MAIRYDKEFNREIQKTVKNFNAKVRRLEREEQEIIPDTVSVKELKQIYQNRRQLKRRLRQLKSFSRRGAEEIITTPGGVEMTEWQFETGRADYTMVKRRLARQIKLQTPKKPSPYLKNEIVQNAEDRLNEMRKSFKDLTIEELRKVSFTVNTEIKRRMSEDIFKKNLLKKLEATIQTKGYDKGILEKFKTFSGEELLLIYNNEQELADIMEFADTDGEMSAGVDMTSRDGQIKISSTQFDAIVNKTINRLPYYEKKYKK